MNQQQTKYVLERINRLKNLKIDNANKNLPDIRLDDAGIRQALSTGNFTVKEKNRDDYRDYLSSYVIFDTEVNNSEARKLKAKEIEKEAQNLIDQVMLGEDEGLLDALREFENKEF